MLFAERKEWLKGFVNGFKNEAKVDTFKLSEEVRSKK
jgi:hypothetical protein